MVTVTIATGLIVEMLAAEQGCPPDLFTDSAVHLREHPAGVAPHPLARPYPQRQPSFVAVSAGSGAVVSAGHAILPAIMPIFAGATRDQVFEPERLAAVAALLRPHSLTVVGPYLRLICTPESYRGRYPPSGYEVHLEVCPDDRRLDELDPARRPNAISRRRVTNTEAAAVATLGGTVVGVATVSADSPYLWQIGIDIDDDHRGRGIGAALTAALARHTLDAGCIPWYGVAAANVASLNTAVAAGFRFGWVEAYAYPVFRNDNP